MKSRAHAAGDAFAFSLSPEAQHARAAPVIQNGLQYIRFCLCSLPTYLLRTVPPRLAFDEATGFDREVVERFCVCCTGQHAKLSSLSLQERKRVLFCAELLLLECQKSNLATLWASDVRNFLGRVD